MTYLLAHLKELNELQRNASYSFDARVYPSETGFRKLQRRLERGEGYFQTGS